MNNIDAYLYREIKPGKEFEKLIPTAPNKSIEAGIGFTDHSIDVMKKCVEDYSWQMELVAEKLEKSSLIECVDAVFNFIYHHFQYKADRELQKLRSPAYSWFDRHNGIDCKSYSILASSILTEMGINHYIRKIIQPAGDSMQGEEKENFESSYSHVYVIVPKNQKTNSISQGYYVIDGTVADNQEPFFLQYKDEFMEGLKHVIMNAPTHSLRGGDGGLTTSIIKEGITNQIAQIDPMAIGGKILKDTFLKKISLNNILGFLKIPISCWGGSAYEEWEMTRDIKEIEAFSVDTLNAMNDALQANNMALFSEKVNWFYGITAHTKKRMAAKRAQGWNSCSTKMFTAAQLALTFWETTVALALDAWLDKSFNVTQGAIVTYDSAKRYQAKSPMQWGAGGSSLNAVTVQLPYENFTKKDPYTQIPSFVVTPYVYSLVTKPTAFDAATYLDDIKNLYNVIQNPASIFNPGDNNPANTSTTNMPSVDPNSNIQNIGSQTKQAGMGTFVGWAIVLAAAGYAINEATKSKPQKTAA